MLRKLLAGLFVVLVGAFGILANPLHTNAATYYYDGKSPVLTGCSNTGVVKASKSFSYGSISGTVYLMFSTSCKTAWSYVKVNSVPSGYKVDGYVVRNTDGWGYSCSNTGGSG